MNYVITEGNISLVLNGTPYLIGRDDQKYDELKRALERFEPEYMVKQIVDPDPEVLEAIEMLKGNFKKEE